MNTLQLPEVVSKPNLPILPFSLLYNVFWIDMTISILLGLLTTYDNVPIAKFFFYKVPAHMLDPVIVEVEPGRRDTATAQQQTA